MLSFSQEVIVMDVMDNFLGKCPECGLLTVKKEREGRVFCASSGCGWERADNKNVRRKACE